MAGRSFVVLCLLLLVPFAARADSDAVDLALEAVRVDPAEIDRGGSVAVSFEVVHSGAVDSVTVEVACRRSDLEADCLIERKVLQLASSPQASQFILDTTALSAGGYRLQLRVDPEDRIGELDETNNHATAWLVVRSPLPDLVPTALAVDPRSPVEIGATVSFSTRIANTGSVHAGAFLVVCELSHSGGAWLPIGSVEIPGLERNGEIVVRFPHTAAADGVYGLRVRAELRDPLDPERGARERDEANNQLTTSFAVVPNDRHLPDLRPVALTLSPSSPLGWLGNATATVVVVNSGGGSTEQGVQVAFQYRRIGASDVAWQDLKDPQHLKDESLSACDPTNWAWAVRPEVDEAEPLSIEAGRNARAISVLIDFAAHEQGRTCQGIAVEPRILPGDYELKAVVDPLNAVQEQDKRNNELVIGFSIFGSDLQAESLELSRSSVARGGDVTVEATVRNTGARTADAFTVGFFVDARRLDTYYYSGTGLGTGDTVTVQGLLRTQDLLEGAHTVRVIVDPDGLLFEQDRANNTISASLEVGGLPQRTAELLVDRIEFAPPTPIPPGYPFTVRAALHNSGDLSAGPFDVMLHVAGTSADVGDPLALPLTVARLEPFETLWVEWGVPPREAGTYTATVEVDPQGGRVAEQDETNNAIEMRFVVRDVGDIGVVPARKANLLCQRLTATPAGLAPGTPVTIAATVANSGTEAAAASDLELGWTYPTGQSQRIELCRVPPLAPDESWQFTRTLDTASFPYGEHQVTVRVDARGEIEEASETDNVCYMSLQIGPVGMDAQVDLVPTSLRFDSPGASLGPGASVEQHQRLYVYVTVRNRGNVPSGPFQVSFATSHGVDIESWTSVGPLDQVEVSYPVPTATPGEFVLSIQVDPDGLVPDADRSNNGLMSTYVVVPSISSVERVVLASGSAARWLAADESTGRVYAVWENGAIRRVDGGSVQDIGQVVGAPAAVVWSFGASPFVSIGTTAGGLYRIDLENGAVLADAAVGGRIVALAPGGTNRIYAATEGGFHELVRSGSEYLVSRLVAVPGEMRGILYDTDRSIVYVLTTMGVHAYGSDLSPRCRLDAANLIGTPARFALAGTGIYVATEAGTGGILYAAGHCTPTGEDTGQILLGWRYPRSGSLAGPITSVVIDPRDVDPIYITTGAGSLESLAFDGALQWSYDADAAIRSTPLADRRTGRVFFGDQAGIPHVVSLSGVDAFEIDSAGLPAVGIVSTLAMVETRERTEFGTRLVRNYYYGTEDGAVYRFATRQ